MNANDVLGGLVERAELLPWGMDSLGAVRGEDKRFPGEALGQFVVAGGFRRPRPGVADDVQRSNANTDLIVAAVNALPLLLEVVKRSRMAMREASAENLLNLHDALARLDEGVKP